MVNSYGYSILRNLVFTFYFIWNKIPFGFPCSWSYNVSYFVFFFKRVCMMNIIFEILAFHSHEICITFNITTLLLFAYIDDYTIANESFLSKMLKNTYPWSACSDKNFYILAHFVTTAICCLFACWWRLFRSDSRHGAQIHVPKKNKKGKYDWDFDISLLMETQKCIKRFCYMKDCIFRIYL